MTQIAVITGATRGIGLATARLLAERGYTIVVTGRDPEAAKQVADQLIAQGHSAESEKLEVTSFESAKCAAEAIADRHDHIDVLVNNAGILPEATGSGDVNFAHPAIFADTMRTNTIGPVNVIEAFLPLLRRAPAGRIVNVSTTMGSLTDQSNPSSPFYSMVVPAYQASKAALNSITIGLSKHLAATPITVTSVCPGFVQTDLTPINRTQAPTTAADAAAIIADAATLPNGSPTGTFIDAAGTVPW